MFHQDTNTLKPETLFEPRPLRTTSIHQVLSSTEISELGTAESYHKTYGFWTNPDNINTTKGQSALYRNWEAEDFVYYEPEEDISHVWYVGYYCDARRSCPAFEIPQVCLDETEDIFPSKWSKRSLLTPRRRRPWNGTRKVTSILEPVPRPWKQPTPSWSGHIHPTKIHAPKGRR